MQTVRRRKKLPHWESATGIYFVTFRVADSLPANVLRALEFERKNIIANAKSMNRELTQVELYRLQRLFSAKIEKYLDAGSGACFLARPSVARLVTQALFHFHGIRYYNLAWCVMPNHVHVVFQPAEGQTLAAVIHTWKSYSAKEANRILRRSGEFWQREYYDHLVRDEGELRRCIRYVIRNPERAGLKNWPWVGTSRAH